MKKIQELKQQLASTEIDKDLNSAKFSLLDQSNESTERFLGCRYQKPIGREVSRFEQMKQNSKQKVNQNQ